MDRQRLLALPLFLASWTRDTLSILRPGPRAWKGAALGAALAGVSRIVLLAATSRTGLGVLAEVLIGLVIGVVSVALFSALVIGAVAVLRSAPKLVVGSVLGAALAVVVVPAWPDGLNRWTLVYPPLVLLEAALGGSLGAILGGELASAARPKKVLTVTCLVLAASVHVALMIWLSGEGSAAHLVQPGAAEPLAKAPISAPDPSQPGPFSVKTLSYGSGTDRRRPEYAAAAGIRTEPVDASLLLPDLKGFKASMRRRYWGFDEKQFPVNGRVWFPDGEGPFPLVLIVHGNHTMEEYSDPGYAYLGELLASRGFILASVDENFLNGSWSGDLEGQEMAARAWMLLQHLKAWRSFHEKPESPFYHQVDLRNIALIGHSRGGEAAAIAAAFNKLSHYPEDANLKFDFNFSIRSVIAIAPSDEFYRPAGRPVPLENVDYFVMHGGHDGDVSTFMGTRQYQRAKFSGQDYHFKCELYIYQANHGQFNTGWGSNDWDSPFGRMLNFKALMRGDDQRRVAKVYISAFLEATLRGQRGYLPLFRDFRTAEAWLPRDIYLNRFSDSSFNVVSDYEEDADPGTTTAPGGTEEGENLKVFREEKLSLRAKGNGQANNVVRLGWEKPSDGAGPEEARASYRITLPEGLAERWQFSPKTRLSFALANAGDTSDPPLVSVELATETTKASLLLSHFAQVNPPLTVRFSKIGWLEGTMVKPSELVPQSYELLLGEFMKANPAFDPASLVTVTLVFDRGREGAVVLDDVGFDTGS
jgi:dienelactone hydrolase